MLNTVFSKEQRMTTAWGVNTGPGQGFLLRSSVGHTLSET